MVRKAKKNFVSSTQEILDFYGKRITKPLDPNEAKLLEDLEYSDTKLIE